MSSAQLYDLSHSQNFLKDPRLIASLLERSSIGPEDLVYEIGPGRGAITEQLARCCRQVVAVEKDARLCAHLQHKFRGSANVVIHSGDFLQQRLPRAAYKVFANIPFDVTSAIIHKLTDANFPPEDAYLAIQREAAEVLLGRPRESMRTILLKPWFDVSVMHQFRRTDFQPRPGVDVVLAHFHKKAAPRIRAAERQFYRDFVVYCFTAWQPTLQAALKNLFSFQQLRRIRGEMGIDLNGAPTSLAYEHWLGLFACFAAVGSRQAAQRVIGSEQRLLQQQNRVDKLHRTRAKGRLLGR